jgi:aspartyl-tRNA(Asn)/glutamyl-tRNA(Gln) amidotransferase subunit A
MNELLGLSLTELMAKITAKEASPVEIMEVVLNRIEEVNEDLNAVVSVRDRDELMKDAKAAESRVMSGDARPMEGVPLGVKDLEDVGGMVTSMGSRPFAENVATQDSDQVARLKAAGAVVLGKTNTPEFGYTAITKNLVYGVTRSPWNLERSPGGSSGGSASAMAGCMLPLVTGSDGGGSVRIPASFSGTYGLKPSYGRISTGPRRRWGYGDTAGHGPITKTVEDAALFMDQVVGVSPHDPNSLEHPGYSYLERLKESSDTKLKIGYSPDLGYAVVQSDIAAAVEAGVKIFESLGHSVEEIKGGPPLMASSWGNMVALEVGGGIYDLLPEHEAEFGRSFLSGIKDAQTVSMAWWGKAAHDRERLNAWCTDTFQKYDILITPTVPFDPPPAGGPFPLEVDGKKQADVGVAAFTIPFNLSWHPAASVRAGISNAGLPIGLQIVGPRHREDIVLRASKIFEQERPWHGDWPTSWSPLSH